MTIQDKLDCLTKLNTWEIVDRSLNANVVSSKWVFKIKWGMASEIMCYKAQLIAQGFTQVPGINYGDTFAPVTKLTSIRILLALVACFD